MSCMWPGVECLLKVTLHIFNLVLKILHDYMKKRESFQKSIVPAHSRCNNISHTLSCSF